MTIEQIFEDKSIKAKGKVKTLGEWLLNGELPIGELLAFAEKLDKAISNLLPNAENNGTVVRWASAYALAEILKLKTENNTKLLPKIKALSDKEEDNGVKKKYLDALKKVKN